MSVKDFNVSENIDREKNPAKADAAHTKDAAKSKVPDGKHNWEEEVKNANASGDGSYGRSDENLENSDEKKEDNNY